MRRPLDIGRVLSAIVEIYRGRTGILLSTSFIFALVIAVAGGILYSGVPTVVGTLVRNLLTFAIATLFTGLVIEIVNDMRRRRQRTVGRLFEAIGPVFVSLLVVAFLYGLGVSVGLLLLLVPGLLAMTWWALVAPVVVLERAGAIEAFRRSYALVRGNSWRVFGVLVLIAIVVLAIALALVVPLSLAFGVGGAVLGFLIAATLTQPLDAIARTVLYHELVARAGGEAPAAPRRRAAAR